MTIKTITEKPNKDFPKFKPIKENQEIYIPDIVDQNISKRNGMIYCLTGSGGSGKSSLLLNLFKNKKLYRNKYHNLFYFCPLASFLSVDKHPFEKHEKVFHELNVPILDAIYHELVALKDNREKKKDKKKNKKDEPVFDSDSDSGESDSDEEDEIEYSCIIIDDFADVLKNKDIQIQLNKMIIKARHLRCGFIFCLQSYYFFPKICRKQITYITIFKPKNVEEWNSIAKELLNYNKEDALKLYNYVFDAPYNHIDIDTVENKLYKNFNILQIEN